MAGTRKTATAKPASATATLAAVDTRAASIAKKRDLVNRQAVALGMTTADRPLVTTLEQRHQMFGPPIPTGSILLDFLLGGGWPRGCSVKLWGPEGCIAANTKVWYKVVRDDGKAIKPIGSTIEHFYKEFNSLSFSPKRPNRPVTRKHIAKYYVNSVTGSGAIVINEVMDVLDKGIKETWTVKTESGKCITATEDHEFLTSNGDTRLDALKVGDNLLLKVLKLVIPDKIVSIESAGMNQVYDIVCADPYRNFIANGIAVHNCGKSNLAMAAAAGVVKTGGYVLWMQAEDGDPWEMAGTYGIEKDDPHFLVYYCQGSGEQAFLGLKTFLMDGRVPSYLLDLVVLDSLAGLEPKDLIDYDTKKNAAGKIKGPEGSQNPGRVAAMYAGIFRYLHSTKGLGTASMLMISQARIDVGGYGSPEISVGGRATDHAARLVIKMRRKSGEGMIKVSKTSGEQVGHTNELTFTKDGYRHRLQGRKASFVAYYKKGIDNPSSYFDLMQISGALIKASSTRYETSPQFRTLLGDSASEFQYFVGAPKAKEALRNPVYLRAAKAYLDDYISGNHADITDADDDEELVEGEDGIDFGAETPEPVPTSSTPVQEAAAASTADEEESMADTDMD